MKKGIAINGTKKVVEYLKRKKEKINFCIVGEPTNPNKLRRNDKNRKKRKSIQEH